MEMPYLMRAAGYAGYAEDVRKGGKVEVRRGTAI
jgi:hypothetical protein